MPERSPSMKIDVHSHLMPSGVFDHPPRDYRSKWSPDRASVVLEDEVSERRGRPAKGDLLDASAIVARQKEQQVDLSIVGGWVDAMAAPTNAESQSDWCRLISSELAAAVERQASLRWLASLPDLDGGLAAEELSVAARAGAVGGILATSFMNGGLGRADLEPLWANAERLGLPIMIHPGVYDPSETPIAGELLIPVFYPYLTTRAAVEMIRAGVPDRYPDLKVVLVHAGGFLPYQFGRVEHWLATDRVPTVPKQSPSTTSSALSWFYYDTVVHSRKVVEFLIDLVGSSQLLAGSDCPFAMSDWSLIGANGDDYLGSSDRAAILGANAERIFPLHRGTTS